MKRIVKSAYRGMRHIGKLGVEAVYEDMLLGSVGFEEVETNAHGRPVRTIERIAPVAGKNLYLNIDAKLQALVEQALGKRRGAVVAMEPKTGAVLAFVSTPTYDPNPFVNGIDAQSYKRLLDNPHKPLINPPPPPHPVRDGHGRPIKKPPPQKPEQAADHPRVQRPIRAGLDHQGVPRAR